MQMQKRIAIESRTDDLWRVTRSESSTLGNEIAADR